MSAPQEALLKEIRSEWRAYNIVAHVEEIAFWTGSSLAAICSGIAGLSIATDFGSLPEPYGKFITAVLAIVPALWAAIDRSLRLRQLSLFNYGVATQLRALALELQGSNADPTTKAAAEKFAAILRNENDAFRALLIADDTQVRDATDRAARTAQERAGQRGGG